MLIRKNRNGPTGECLLALDGPRMRFTDMTALTPPSHPHQRPPERGFGD
jgi:hypothetical protein